MITTLAEFILGRGISSHTGNSSVTTRLNVNLGTHKHHFMKFLYLYAPAFCFSAIPIVSVFSCQTGPTYPSECANLRQVFRPDEILVSLSLDGKVRRES